MVAVIVIHRVEKLTARLKRLQKKSKSRSLGD